MSFTQRQHANTPTRQSLGVGCWGVGVLVPPVKEAN